MKAIYVLGRIAFAFIFIISGAQKLMDIAGTAQLINTTVVVPPELSSIRPQLENLRAQLEGMTGMTFAQLLAIISGVVELGGGLMIAANIGTRVAALALILFTAFATFYFHDFWHQAGEIRANNLIHAQKNLAIIGALMVFFVLGSWRPAAAQTDSGAVVPQRY